MLRTLYGKLLTVLITLFLLLGILLILLSAFSTDLYQREVSQKLYRELAAHIVAEQRLLAGPRADREALEHLFHMMMVINPAIEIYLLDPEGRILATAAPDPRLRRTQIDLAPLRTFLGGRVALPILGDDPRVDNGRKAFSAAPITRGATLQGYLYVILGGENYDSVVQRLQGSHIGRLSAGAVAACLLFALAAAAIVLWLMTRRLKLLTLTMERFRADDFSALLVDQADSGRPRDEIDRLNASFRRMTRVIDNQVRRLKHNDALRRELIANVSHDLRTPLALLQGHLETLLIKNDSLSEAERGRHVETAAHQCRGLARRIAELFELAKLEAQETLPQREPFSIAELVQDVVLKFRLEAERRQVTIAADMAPALPFVHADIGLIERALDNLLGNALRHTPGGGEVRIGLAATTDRLCLRVGDTGRGIPPEDLPHIFDRFYRNRRGAAEAHDGAGLGLAITRRIVELHGGTIVAVSEPNRGACFTICLPLGMPDKKNPASQAEAG